MGIRKIFNDDVLNEYFLNQGYVITNLIDSQKAKQLLHFFEKQDNIHVGEIFYTTLNQDFKFRNIIHQFIQDTIAAQLNDLLYQYKPLYSAFIVKKRSLLKGKIGFHADWQFTDEERYISLNVWVALQDVNSLSGCLKVIPKSHTLHNNLRGPNYQYNQKFDTSKALSIPLKKGQALIYNTKLLHASSYNLKYNKRTVASCLLIPEEATPHYIYFNSLNPSQTPEIYQVSDDFYLKHCIFEMKSGIWNKPEMLTKKNTI